MKQPRRTGEVDAAVGPRSVRQRGSPPPLDGASQARGSRTRRSEGTTTSEVPPPFASALVALSSEEERWLKNHPLYIKITQRGYPLPFGEREILGLRSCTPKEDGGLWDPNA